MKIVVYILILALFCGELANQFYIHSLVSKLYKQVYNGHEKLSFYKKVKWLKSNTAQFKADEQERVNKILFHRKLSIYLIIALFAVFYGSLMLGINK